MVIPFSHFFQWKRNLLLYGTDRMIRTILRRTIEKDYSNDLLLYQGIIQPNRSNDGTSHVCLSLTNLNLISHPKINPFFETIDSCLGNCIETYWGNIFLRQILSEQSLIFFLLSNLSTLLLLLLLLLLSNEQFNVPICCIVPAIHKYDLIIDHIPRYLEEYLICSFSEEMLILFNWLLTNPKKISFNSKVLLHHLIVLLSDSKISSDIICII
jgi:hypothetical protein